MGSLNKSVAIITGASRGIGFVIALYLASYQLLLISRNQGGLRKSEMAEGLKQADCVTNFYRPLDLILRSGPGFDWLCDLYSVSSTSALFAIDSRAMAGHWSRLPDCAGYHLSNKNNIFSKLTQRYLNSTHHQNFEPDQRGCVIC